MHAFCILTFTVHELSYGVVVMRMSVISYKLNSPIMCVFPGGLRALRIDWSVREGTRAELRVLVRNLLDKYGYPPDFSKSAVDLVIRQAESLTEEWLQDSIID